MCAEVQAAIYRHAVHLHGNRLLIEVIVEALHSVNPKIVSQMYEFISERLDREMGVSSPEVQSHNEQVRRYVGEVLSVIGPDAPLPI